MPPTNSLIASKKEIKKALILAGGGVRLAYQAGVLQALQEAGLQFSHFDGTSGGIFNTAMLASGISPDEMAERWRKLKIGYFMSGRPVKSYLKPLNMMAFGDADGIREKVFPALGIDLNKIKSNQEINATFNVCNFSDKSVEAVPHHQVTEDHLIAGVSLPIFMPAIKINNDWYSDAVWIKDANLMEAVKKGAEEIWLLWAIGNNTEYLPGFFNQYVHMIEMSANGGLLEEYAQINRLNERIAKGDSPFGQKAPIRLHVIKPEYPLPLDPALFFKKIDTTTLINMGYADTKNYLEAKSDKGEAFDAAASKMHDPGISLSFRQHYTGNLLFKEEKTKVAYHPAFVLREWANRVVLQVDASIYVEALGREIPTYQNEVRVRKTGKRSTIFVTSLFQHLEETYQLKGEVRLGMAFDWQVGLEFKRIKISVAKIDNGKENILLGGFLTQSIRNRFKYLYRTNVDTFGKRGSKRKAKRRLISKLYQNEI